jgi:hypothetical protein
MRSPTLRYGCSMAADLIDDAHAQAVLGLLNAGGEITVYDGSVPTIPEPGPGAPLPYLLLYLTVDWPDDGAANALNNQAVTAKVTLYCHCVGETAASARAMQMQARSRLLNVRPVVAGRVCTMIGQDEVLAPQRDETTGRLVMDGVSTFGFISAPG